MRKESQPENVILIVCDCLRNDFAENTSLMPFFNEFKKNHIYIDKSYTNAPDTSFAMTTMLTGYMPLEVSLSYGINRKNINKYLPKIFRDIGYQTIGITGNVKTSRVFGYDKYFDIWEDFWSKKDTQRKHELLKKIYQKIPKQIQRFLKPSEKLFKKFSPDLNIDLSCKVRGQDILTVLRDCQFAKKNFLFLHLMEPHAPYGTIDDINRYGKNTIQKLNWKIYTESHKLSSEEVSLAKDLYRNEVKMLDEVLEKIFLVLRESLDLNKIKYVITADHGEAFGEKGYFTHPGYRVDNLHHIKTPTIVNKGFDHPDESFWTQNIYNYLLPSGITKAKTYNFCLGYKKEQGSYNRYYPVVKNDLKKIEDIDSLSELPFETVVSDLKL